MNQQPFENKIIVVTGGASGIGRAVVNKFGSASAKVAILDMDRDHLLATEKEVRAAGVTIMGVQCDVTSETQCKLSFLNI